MEDLFNLIKNNYSKNSVFISIIIGIINFFGKQYSLIGKTVFIEINISLFLVVLFFLIRNILKEIIDTKEKGFALSKNLYSDKQIKVARLGQYLNYSFLLVPLYFLMIALFLFIKTTKSKEEMCNENVKKTGLLIARFNKPNRNDDDDDDFSSTLYSKLDSYLQNSDEINLKQLDKFISTTNNFNRDTLKEVYSANCYNNGLLIFGKRNDKDAKLFLCKIFALNFFSLKANSYETYNKTIIYIQNPDLLDFSIEYEANIISKFILGLLYYHEGKYELSNQIIQEALNLNTNKQNKPFISICHFFIGNDLVKLGRLSDAINHYNTGISTDSTNANFVSYLHYNLAAVKNNIGDSKTAIKEYKIAERLNSNLHNPLQEKRDISFTRENNALFKRNGNKKDSTEEQDHELTHMRNSAYGKWEESFVEISENNKRGIINNRRDTIVKCEYDEIETIIYKQTDCFIVKKQSRYGAIIHKHYDYGTTAYTIYKIPVQYTYDAIMETVKRVIDE